MEVAKDIGTYIGPFVLDVWHKIFTYCDAIALARLCQCCRGFRRTIAGDAYLAQVLRCRLQWITNNSELSSVTFGRSVAGVIKSITDEAAFKLVCHSLWCAYDQFDAKVVHRQCVFPCFERSYEEECPNEYQSWIWGKYLYRRCEYMGMSRIPHAFLDDALFLEAEFPDVFHVKTLVLKDRGPHMNYCICAHAQDCCTYASLCRYCGDVSIVILRVKLFPQTDDKRNRWKSMTKENVFMLKRRQLESERTLISSSHMKQFMRIHEKNTASFPSQEDEWTFAVCNEPSVDL